MQAIRSKRTKPEEMLAKALWHRGYRYRRNLHTLVGKPDIVFTRRKVAVFCDGEFWHGKDWEIKKQKLTSNQGYWVPKIERNMARDREVNYALLQQGWLILRFWSKDILKNLPDCVSQIEAALIRRS